MKKNMILKLVGITIATMATLVLISFAEVAVYSYLINTGHDASFYEAHAQVSAPWISIIFGFILFYLVVRFWSAKNFDILKKLAILYPLIYTCIDLLIILTAASVDWSEFYIIFIAAQVAKFAGSFLAYYTAKPE